MFSATIGERNNTMSAGGSSARSSGSMSSSHLMQIQRMVAANRQQQQQQQLQHNHSSFSSENSNHNKEGRGSMDYTHFNNFSWNNNSGSSPNNGGSNSGSSAGRDNNFFPPPHLMNPIGNAATAAAAAAAAASNVSPATFLNTMPYAFKCPECAIPKNSMDDLEIHIKTEHLNWLPFRCPFCSATRASDTQMIEHIHSYHKKTENQYVYINNPVSKRLYKEMIDRAWHNALSAGAASVAGALSASMRASGINNSSSPSRGGNGSMIPPPLPHNQLSAAMNGSFSNHSNFSSNLEFNGDECGSGSNFSGGGSGSSMSSRGKFSKNIDALAAGLAQRRTGSNHHNGDSSNFDGKPVAGATVVAKRSSNTDELLAQLQQQYAKSSVEHNNNNNVNNGSRNEENRSLENQDDDDDNDVIPLDDNGGAGALLFGQNTEDDDGNGNGSVNGLDDETRVQLSNFFGSVKGSDFDVELANTLSANLFGQGNNGSGGDGGTDSDTSSALQNVAALFSASSGGRLFDGGSDVGGEAAGSGNLSALMNGGSSAGTSGFSNNYSSAIRRRAPRGCGNNQSISKKRVLGECSSCHKPVTAGARQMHMFFHLGKDHNTYRFRCKYPDCDVEHYRKDQMENHQSKVHGKIDAEMMEDRSLELYNLCQKMSMDLLGTAGNTPGPTAAKAQVMYDQLQREAELAALRKRKRNRPPSFHNNAFNSPFFSNSSHFQSSGNGSAASGNGRHQPSSNNFFDRAAGADFSPGSNASGGGGSTGGNINKADADFFRQLQQLSAGNSTAPTNKDEIECQSCHKVMLSKTRGFHILWHLNTDLGIIRYGCRYCDFRHDRPQSVSTHGKKEHGDENCIDDSISNYEEEVRSMSKACFGREQLFAKEERRRKIERNNERAALAEQEMLSMVAQSLGTPSVLSDDLAADDATATLKSDDDSNVDGGLLIDADGGGDCDASSSPPPKLDHHTMGDASSPAASHPPNIKITFSRLKEEPPSKPPMIPQQRSASGTSLNASGGGGSSSSKRKSTRRFGIRRPKSRKQKEIMAKLREVSMRLGGAQYFKKKSTESVPCEKCGKFNASRLSHHAYSHLEGCDLFLCPLCDLGHFSRDIVMKHLKDFHGSNEMPTDNRMRYAQQIKDAIRECYPSCFVDAPIPTPVDIERLKANLNLSDKALATLDVHNGSSASADAINHVDDVMDDEDLEEEELEEDEAEEQHQHENDEDTSNATAVVTEEREGTGEKRKEESTNVQAEMDGIIEHFDEQSEGSAVKRPRLDDADETADQKSNEGEEEEEEMGEELEQEEGEEDKMSKQPTVTTRRAASVRQQLQHQ